MITDCPISNLELIWFNNFTPLFISNKSCLFGLLIEIKFSALSSGRYFMQDIIVIFFFLENLLLHLISVRLLFCN